MTIFRDKIVTIFRDKIAFAEIYSFQILIISFLDYSVNYCPTVCRVEIVNTESPPIQIITTANLRPYSCAQQHNLYLSASPPTARRVSTNNLQNHYEKILPKYSSLMYILHSAFSTLIPPFDLFVRYTFIVPSLWSTHSQ